MKKLLLIVLLFVSALFGFSQDPFTEYDKLNSALRGLSLVKFPSSEGIEKSILLYIFVRKGIVDKVQFAGEQLHPASASKCLCTEEEILEEINKRGIRWELLMNQMNCDTNYAILPIIFRNETKAKSIPKGATFYRDCIELLFENKPSTGGCSVLLKPLLIILKDVVDN